MSEGERSGIGFIASIGVSLAVVISYEANHSIGWAILHGAFNWFYVIYHVIFS